MPAKLFVQFAAGSLEPAIVERQGSEPISPGQVALRDLGRYYRLLAAEMERIDYTPEEAVTVAFACRHWPSIPEAKRPPLGAQVEQYLDDPDHAKRYAAYNGAPTLTSGEAFALRLKMRDLTPAGIVATVDGIERFWDRVATSGDDVPVESDLLDAGLISPRWAPITTSPSDTHL